LYCDVYFSEITVKKDIQLAIAAVPKESAGELEDIIAKSKIRGVMNFVPVTLQFKTRRRIAVVDVDLAQKLYIMTYLIKRGKGMK
jgi:NADH/NAD ratio-sensing transcriptional regulator Rex